MGNNNDTTPKPQQVEKDEYIHEIDPEIIADVAGGRNAPTGHPPSPPAPK